LGGINVESEGPPAEWHVDNFDDRLGDSADISLRRRQRGEPFQDFCVNACVWTRFVFGGPLLVIG
jgi:hypothetical protein